ncbi:MAG: Alpha/beta hydrolase family protein [Gemmatimonadetes bacterium]|nr:Alpha/beta hydrolase family protein [Gemmatimonadota bacterium]
MPDQPGQSDPPIDPRTFNHERFELRPRDGGQPIRGDVRFLSGTTPRTAVVICHGFKGFREWGFFPALARAIAGHGHAAVTFDFSRNGVGADGVDFSALDRFGEQTHTRNLAEIRSVVDALHEGHLLPEAPRSVGLFGHSRGGGEAVLAAAGDPRVKALVTWAAIATVERWTPEQVAAWERGETVHIANSRTGQQMPVGPAYWKDVAENRERLDVLAAAARVKAPWLIVHGDADTSVSVEDAEALFAAATGDDTELFTLEGADHTFGAVHPYRGATDDLHSAADATLDWFDTWLRPTPAS